MTKESRGVKVELSCKIINHVWKSLPYKNSNSGHSLAMAFPGRALWNGGRKITISEQTSNNIKAFSNSTLYQSQIFGGSVSNEGGWDARTSKAFLRQLYAIARTLYNTISLRPTPTEKNFQGKSSTIYYLRSVERLVFPHRFLVAICIDLLFFSKSIMLCLISWFSKKLWCIYTVTLYWRAVMCQIPY